jgi:8-oxo-dGTP pyrophosphatase MutT (NUDIX family)
MNEIVIIKRGESLKPGMFDIENTFETIDVTNKGIAYIANNYRQLWMQVKIDSAMNTKYRPFSYRKVHIDSFYKDYISAGDESLFRYKIKLSAIEYFDHLLVRNYLNKTISTRHEELGRFLYDPDLTTEGFEDTEAFVFLAGCGVWVISDDNYLLVSRRGNKKSVLEKPGDIGYSAAGSCEYTNRLSNESNIKEYEANPFVTAARELGEECNIIVDPEDLTLISFGIDYDRYLQQFSFFYQSDKSAEYLLEKSKTAVSSNEQVLFAVPFTQENITHLLDRLEIEPGAMVSLIRLWFWRER